MPAPIDPRYPHEARLNPLERPERRWRCHAIDLAAKHPVGTGGPTP